MLAVLNRYKIFLIIMSFVLLILLLALFIAGQLKEKTPSRGVFVFEQMAECSLNEGGEYHCSR